MHHPGRGLKYLIALACTVFGFIPINVYSYTLTAQASSQLVTPNWPADHVVDGNGDATVWSSDGYGDPNHTEWIMVESDEMLVLSGVTIYPRMSLGNSLAFPDDYYIEYSYDDAGTNWWPVAGEFYTAAGVQTGTVTHTFDGTIVARRLRITATKLQPDDSGNIYYFQLGEIELQEATNEILPFETSVGGEFDARLNMLWKIYGVINDGSSYNPFDDPATGYDDPWDTETENGWGAVFDFGNEASYAEWMTLKYIWSGATADKAASLRDIRLAIMPQSADGYMWSWLTQEPWAVPDKPYHQDNNAKYILSLWRFWCWTQDDSLFDIIDSTVVSAPTDTSRPDVSQNMTIREKLRLAMQYLETEVGGSGGGITIQDTDFEGTGGGYMDNDGTRATGHPSNYWDNYHFGYKNGYDNVYYYAALEAMAQMEEHWGDATRAAQLRTYQAGCKAEYEATFWDASKGRYIGCIDKNGVTHDYGFTFMNLEALSYGLGDASKATDIFDWLDGNRIIAGETSTGADIYNYGYAPRANTIAIESVGSAPYWWSSGGGAINPATNAAYALHLENGGAIFYTAFYDLMARIKYQGPDAALTRLNGIVNEFAADQLRHDPTPPGGAIAWAEGIIGEFPESGLVPCAIVYGFAGLSSDINGLTITPALPSSWSYLTVRQINFAGATLDITVEPTQVTLESYPSSTDTIYIENTTLTPGASVTVPLGADGSVTTRLSAAPTITGEPTYTAGTNNTVFWPAVATATSYTLERATNASFSSGLVSVDVAAPATQYTFNGLSDVTYWYRVRSQKSATVKSAWSLETSSTQDSLPPSTPSAPTDGGTWSNDTNISFDWLASSDSGSGMQYFTCQIGTSPNGNNILDSNVGNTLSRNITGTHGSTYYCRVRPTDNVGNDGSWSASSNGITVDTAAPQAPTTPDAGVTVTNDPALTFSWSANDIGPSGIAGYQCQIGSSAGANDVLDTVVVAGEASLTGNDGVTYYARARATDQANNTGSWSSNSAGVLVDTGAPSATMSAPSGSSDSTLLTLIWNATDPAPVGGSASGVDTVAIYIDKDGAGYTLLGNYPSGTLTTDIDVSSLGGSGIYHFYAVATDLAGNSESASASAEVAIAVQTPTSVSPKVWNVME